MLFDLFNRKKLKETKRKLNELDKVRNRAFFEIIYLKLKYGVSVDKNVDGSEVHALAREKGVSLGKEYDSLLRRLCDGIIKLRGESSD